MGLSNYHVSEVARCFALCEQHRLVKPSVYQVSAGVASESGRFLVRSLLLIADASVVWL